jgi:hypothetical protein
VGATSIISSSSSSVSTRLSFEGVLGARLVTRPDLTAFALSSVKVQATVSDTQNLTVRGKGTVLLGSGSFLASSSALLHRHLHASSGLGFGDEDLSCLFEDAGAVFDSVVSLVEVTSDGCVVDLKKVISRVQHYCLVKKEG